MRSIVHQLDPATKTTEPASVVGMRARRGLIGKENRRCSKVVARAVHFILLC